MFFIYFLCLIRISFCVVNSINNSVTTGNPCLSPNFNLNVYSVSSLSSFSMQDVCQISLIPIGNKMLLFLLLASYFEKLC